MSPRPTPPPPSTAPPPLLVHSHSMFNGMPWETEQSIGESFDNIPWRTLNIESVEDWTLKLFRGVYSSGDKPNVIIKNAIMKLGERLQWGEVATHQGQCIGVVSWCQTCAKVCRISWSEDSPVKHMREQRALILSWLNLQYEMPFGTRHRRPMLEFVDAFRHGIAPLLPASPRGVMPS
jgi:hypothetical protein